MDKASDIVNHELICRHARVLLSGIHSSIFLKKHGSPIQSFGDDEVSS